MIIPDFISHNKMNRKSQYDDQMETITTDIMLALAEVDKTIISNPTTSIKNVYDQKEIELVNKYGPELVAAYLVRFIFPAS
jgi:hypothetical protein